MTALDSLMQSAAAVQMRIALSEGADPRVIEATIAARRGNVAQIVLVGKRAEIEAGFAAAIGLSLIPFKGCLPVGGHLFCFLRDVPP